MTRKKTTKKKDADQKIAVKKPVGSNPIKPINLALQGGGSHGAFAWGVLDKLLEDGRFEIDGLSATSAGAMNAAVYAYHKMKYDIDGARQGLEDFWRRISKAGASMRTPIDGVLDHFGVQEGLIFNILDNLSRVLSPYQLNPFSVNPLREVLEESVDFDELHACYCTNLSICATNVRTGRIRIFKNHEVTADVIMASACLPFIFQAVEIEGESYWDGGYMGNPAIFPLFSSKQSSDVVIVHINPIVRDEIPKTAPAIVNRLNEITFNSTLLREMRAINFVHDMLDEGWIKNEHRHKVKYIHVHSIRNDKEMSHHTANSKFNTSWKFLTHLRDDGRETAAEWIDQNFQNVGKKSTIDIAKEFL